VTAVAAGSGHTVALLEDGSLRCWGGNTYGQCDVLSGVGNNENPVMSIAAGSVMTIALLASPVCPADFNGDGVVDGEELTYLLGAWGTDDPVADVNDDGIVDGNDLTIILAGWGACP
jgi:hypothetical protein